MPTYDYQCAACSHAFEKFHAPSERVSKTCPKCGKRKVARLIGTGAGVIFKGSGFYGTDYRSSSYKAGAEKESGGKKKTDDKPCTGTSTSTGTGTPSACGGPACAKD